MRQTERRESTLRAPRTLWHLLVRNRYRFSFDLMPVEIKAMSWGQRLNLLRNGLNLIYRRARAWSWPIHMQIELTNYCNLRCPICPTGSQSLKRPPVPMDPALFERLLKEAGPRLLTLAFYAWGEPLLHPHLPALLKIAGKYNIATFLSTNGQNLDKDYVLDALITYPPTYLIVAVDGLSDATHSKFRVGAQLEPILTGVRKLAALKKSVGSALPVLHMRFMVMSHNQHERALLKDFAENHGFEFLSIRTLSTIDSPQSPYSDYLPNADAETFRAFEYKDGEKIRRPDFVCMHPFSYPTVFSNGAVVACEQDFNAQHPYGTLSHNSSFEKIWFSERAAMIRRTIRDAPSGYSFCRNCPFADRPVSSCSILAYDLRRPGQATN